MLEVWSLRRNPALSGLMPSAMYATVTPEPSMPRAAAVLAVGSSERALIDCSASGSSWGLLGAVEHAVAGTCAGAAAIAGLASRDWVLGAAGVAGAVVGAIETSR